MLEPTTLQGMPADLRTEVEYRVMRAISRDERIIGWESGLYRRIVSWVTAREQRLGSYLLLYPENSFTAHIEGREFIFECALDNPAS